MTNKIIDLIVDSLATSRRDFSDMFLRAQQNQGISLADRLTFEAITRSADDKQAYREVLQFCARQEKLFHETAHLIMADKMDAGELRSLLEQHASHLLQPPFRSSLQAIIDISASMEEPMVTVKGLGDCAKWTGKVMIGGVPRGSGVLIAAQSFLTCWHVLKDMFTRDAHGNYVPKENPPQLEILFDDYLIREDERNRAPRPCVVEAAADWLEFFSICHDSEHGEELPACSELDNHWDYAVVKLAKAADKERSWAKLDERAIVPAAGSRIRIFQHPNGHRQHHVVGNITDGDCTGRRFYHLCNTLPGSSGASCFGDDFTLVGIHQGCRLLQNGHMVNCGIPIVRIAEDIARQREALGLMTQPAMRPQSKYSLVLFTDTYTYQPVIGIDDFQHRVLKNIQSQKGYILTIQGELKSGKSYCIQALYSLLDNADHLKIHLSAEIISNMSPEKLARYICQAAGGELEAFAPASDYSETASWLRNELMEAVMAVLQARRGSRMVWICICNLNIYNIEDRNASELLLLLYECVMQHSWLQFVLDDPKKELPANLSAASQCYKLREKSPEDLQQYIERFLQKLKIEHYEEAAYSFAKYLYEQYKMDRQQNETLALSKLNAACRNLLNEFLNAISNKHHDGRSN